jgi:DNA-binding GntR family transcriptional regulator
MLRHIPTEIEGGHYMAREDAPYLTIADELRRRIQAEVYRPGTYLPHRTELAREFKTSRTTIDRAVGVLEAEGLAWGVPRRGTVVRYGMTRPRRPRGNIVKRNTATDSPGYSFPAASGTEVWHHHITPTATDEKLDDPRLAKMLGVPEGSSILRRHRVTGPVTEPPFEICDSWIHPDAVKDAPEVAKQDPGPGGWLARLEKAGHWPISWIEFHRGRLPTAAEAAELQIPLSVPVLEIVRVGRSGRTGKPIEVTMYVIPSDRVETVQVLDRDDSAKEPWPADSEM